MRKRRRGQNGGVLDAHTVVHLVAVLQPTQNRNGVLDSRLAHQHWLKAPLERRVFLDVLLIFVERCRADGAQLAPGQRRLQHIRGVHRALRRACAHQGVQFVDEQNDLPLGLCDLFQHGLQPVLELAAIFRTSHQRGQVERHQPLRLQDVGHIAGNNPLRQAFHDGRLPHARLANEHGIVLCPPREDLHDAPNLFVPPDHGIELGAARQVGQVPRVLFQRAVGSLRILRGHALAAPHARQRLQDGLMRSALPLQQLSGGIALLPGNREEQVLRRNVFVLEPLGFVKRALQDIVQGLTEMLLRNAGDFWQPVKLTLDFLSQGFGGDTKPRKKRRHDTVSLRHECRKQVQRLDLLVVVPRRYLMGLLQRLLRLHGHLVKSQHGFPRSRYSTSRKEGPAASPAPPCVVWCSFNCRQPLRPRRCRHSP